MLSLKLVGRRAKSLRLSLALVPLVLSFGALASVAPSNAAAPTRGSDNATAAKTLSLNVTSSMHLVGRPGHVFNEQGTVSGTLSGTAYIHSTAITTNSGVSTITFKLKNGSISGRALTRGRIVGATVYFSGSGSITGGTGSWAHASGKNMQYSGTLNRQNFHVTSHLVGTINP